MTRQIEAELEARQEREQKALLGAVYGGLVRSIEKSGGNLERISVRMMYEDTLLTMVANFPGGHMVCHVGSFDLAGCLVRAWREARRESLTWREDKYRQNGG